MKRKTQEDFIIQAKLVHGDRYDYSLVEYKNNASKIKIRCYTHEEFEQTPIKHLSGQNCNKCSVCEVHLNQRKTIDSFYTEANLIHKNKYDYSLVNYKNNRTKIKIKCPIHGVFEQIPLNHLKGKGCLYCGGTSGLDTNSFIQKSILIHGDRYDYSLVDYNNSYKTIKIICPEHGVFEQTPNNHLNKKQGCFKCLGKICDTSSFVKYCSEKHNNKYDYSLVDYFKITDEVKIVCPIHGEFKQRCDSHKQGNGCNKCSNNGTSEFEKEVGLFMKENGIIIKNNDKTILNGKEIDILIPSHNVAIECNGLYWHSEEYIDKNYHLNKTELCEKQGIQLIHIFEDEWLFKKEIVKSRLLNILGLTTRKIYARKTEIIEVTNEEARDFLNINHIQGYSNSKIKLGLYYNNELVSLMTFGGLRKVMGQKQIEGSFELIRFCNQLNTTVIGGADKLLKHFIKIYKPKEVISYADRRWSMGGLYEKLGFNFVKNTTQNYFYLINKNREYRFKYRKDVLISQGFDSSISEHKIMLSRGIYRVYDCGNKKYSLIFDKSLLF
jgi:hypothetical protein